MPTIGRRYAPAGRDLRMNGLYVARQQAATDHAAHAGKRYLHHSSTLHAVMLGPR